MAKLTRWFKPLALVASLAVVLVAAGTDRAVSATGCNGTWWIEKTSLYMDEPVPEFGFSTCEGDEIEISELRERPLVINFWATWCGPCIKELPNFVEKHEEHGEEVTFLGISVDQDPEIIRRFLDYKPLPYMLAWDSAGIARDLGIQTIPFTIAVDAEGKVAGVHRGYASTEDLEELMGKARRATSED